ncbi:MAG: hypothetical protein ACJ8IR_01140 [Alphaproteobacteria bacterium]|jgi:hypothetical protein
MTPDFVEMRNKLAHYRSQTEAFLFKAAATENRDARAELLDLAETWRQLTTGAETLIREMEAIRERSA